MSDDGYKPLNHATIESAKARARDVSHKRGVKLGRSEQLTSPPGRGFACAKPYQPENPETGEMFNFQCGQCGPCINRRTNYVAGRCMAESNASETVQMLTLTFAKDDGWHKKALGRCKQFIRDECKRRSLDRPKYYCVAELGGKNGRRHYHLLLFFSGPSPFPQSPLDRDGQVGRETWKGWPLGFVQFKDVKRDNITGQSVINRCRYVASYVAEGKKNKDIPAPSQSVPRGIDEWGDKVGMPLGYRAAIEHGRAYAEKGLPLPKTMKIDGLRD